LDADRGRVLGNWLAASELLLIGWFFRQHSSSSNPIREIQKSTEAAIAALNIRSMDINNIHRLPSVFNTAMLDIVSVSCSFNLQNTDMNDLIKRSSIFNLEIHIGFNPTNTL